MESIPTHVQPSMTAQVILDDDVDEYEFMTVDQECVVDDSLPRLQVMQFLNDGNTGYGALNNYPLINIIFFKFNAGNKMFNNIKMNLHIID